MCFFVFVKYFFFKFTSAVKEKKTKNTYNKTKQKTKTSPKCK